MRNEVLSFYSKSLGRNISVVVYGKKGKPCLCFPPFCGSVYDFESFGMIDLFSPYRDKINPISIESIDSETFSQADFGKSSIERHEKWFRFVTDTIVPSLKEKFKTADRFLTTGCSMGGYHSANFFFRRPDLFETVIAMSAVYDASFFFKTYSDKTVLLNSPAHFLKTIKKSDKRFDLYNRSNIILSVGMGKWEEDMIENLRSMNKVLFEKRISAWVDFWGLDVDHDWPWWQKMLTYFLQNLESEKRL